MKIIFFTISFLLFITGCSTYVENKKAEDFIPIHQEISFAEKDDTIDGSIYNDKSSGFFASDRRAKNVGDILTITLNESLSASKSTTNTTAKTDTFGVTLPPLFSNGAGTKSIANQLDNKLGIGNGGVESSDFAAGANQSFSGAGTAAFRASRSSRCVTISLNINFIASTKLDDEIIGFVKVLKRTKSMVFLICHLKSNKKIIASASGIWKILK